MQTNALQLARLTIQLETMFPTNTNGSNTSLDFFLINQHLLFCSHSTLLIHLNLYII